MVDDVSNGNWKDFEAELGKIQIENGKEKSKTNGVRLGEHIPLLEI